MDAAVGGNLDPYGRPDDLGLLELDVVRFCDGRTSRRRDVSAEGANFMGLGLALWSCSRQRSLQYASS